MKTKKTEKLGSFILNIPLRKTFDTTVTNKYAVEPVTRYRVVHSSDRGAPDSLSMAFGQTVCECESQLDAERIASALATTHR